MPSLSDSLIKSGTIPEGYAPVRPSDPIATPIEAGTFTSTQPTNVNTFQRCPLPPIWAANPDSVRGFYQSGKVPQFRFYAQSLNK